MIDMTELTEIIISRFSRTCFLDTDGDVTCAACPEGYEGRRCERCARGYTGDPMTPGSSCIKDSGRLSASIF